MKQKLLNWKNLLYFHNFFIKSVYKKEGEFGIIIPLSRKMLLLAFLVFSFQTYSQKLILPGNDNPNDYLTNPSLAGFNDYSNQELVDLYTGMVNINIPIYTVQNNDLQVPISLSYRKDGILVDEKASDVGLGWGLNTVGYIKRQVKGNPDEDIYGTNDRGDKIRINYGRFNNLKFRPLVFGDVIDDFIIDDYVTMVKNRNYNDNNCIPSKEFSHLKVLSSVPSRSGSSYPEIEYHFQRMMDTQPDIFYYKTPTASGSFVLNRNGNPVIISGNTDVVISPAIGPEADPINPEWVITTPNGISYAFPHTDEYTETTENYMLHPSIGAVAGPKETKEQFMSRPNYRQWQRNSNLKNPRDKNHLINTWYPSKINSLRFKSEIVLTYKDQGPIEEFKTTEQRMHYIKTFKDQYDELERSLPNYCDGPERPYSRTTSFVSQPTGTLYDFYANTNDSYWIPNLSIIKNPKYISKISFGSGSVNFKYKNSDRSDLPGNHALDQIVITNNDNHVIKKFGFRYDYFIAFPYQNLQKSSRLKLLSFSEIATTGNEKKQHRFEYHEHIKLPSYESNQQDYWGYFNANTANTLIPTSRREGINYPGANREPDENRMKAAMLKKIIYPTGGYSEIEYEINTYKDKDLRLEHNIGGLRIKKTITATSSIDSKKIIKNYTYGRPGASSGSSVNFVDRNWYHNFQRDAYLTSFDYDNKFIERYFYIRKSAQPIYPLLKTKGGWVGYQEVTVNIPGLGKSVYQFTNPQDNPDGQGQRFLSPFRSESAFDPHHDIIHISKDPLRGLLKEKTDYDENGRIIRAEYIDYEENPRYHNQIEQNILTIENEFLVNTTRIWHPDLQNLVPPFPHQTAKFYNVGQVQSYFPFIKKRTIKTFGSDTPDHMLNEVTYQKNSASHMQTTRVISEGSDRKKRETLAYYPGDTFPTDNLLPSERSAIFRLKEQNRIQPVFIENRKEDNVIGVTRNVYDERSPGSVRIKKIQRGINKDHLEDQSVFRYNSTGNVRETYRFKDTPKAVYIWGYNDQLPIVKIEGKLSYKEIEARFLAEHGKRLFFLKDISNKPSDNHILEDWLDKFRTTIQTYDNTCHITTYLHKPLIGITSIKDPKGNLVSYEYDLFNRLKETKDSEGNLITKSEYHFNISNNE
ncbi:RHS repeat domain-containing protein [Aquimarina mytili]|uniref:RHS repeat protein n=1 Tax=Aquimarina mytili TaxID=874423 RepID=A0A936ZUE6_9FLAO|nr:RHS repeat domain-containing protein [Aquimarina mytili]MBL0682103.1 RHS repeat protein [Aquimarina mytili]